MSEATNYNRRQFLRTAALAFGASQIGVSDSAGASLFEQGPLSSLSGSVGWLNSPPLTKESLRGKIVLIDFWTYTCINWRRTLPYLRAWHEKYKNQGLIVVGVHTPEFAFEHDKENVRKAVEHMKIAYPIAIDSEYAVWRAFRNEYWPALYLADADGRPRYHKFGEGNYEATERTVQTLLRQTGANRIDSALVSISAEGAEAAADWPDLKSQENYLGYERTVGFASPGGAALDKPHGYDLARRLSVNEWALAGNWTARKDAITLNSVSGRIAYRFHARDLHLVMGPGIRKTPPRFVVSIDGQAPGAAHGVDSDEHGNGLIAEPRMYQLIRQSKPFGDRPFEIEFFDAGAEVFSFTFG